MATSQHRRYKHEWIQWPTGGFRWYNGMFEGLNTLGRWWDSHGYAPITNLSNSYTVVAQSFLGQTWGLSVRCAQN